MGLLVYLIIFVMGTVVSSAIVYYVARNDRVNKPSEEKSFTNIQVFEQWLGSMYSFWVFILIFLLGVYFVSSNPF